MWSRVYEPPCGRGEGLMVAVHLHPIRGARVGSWVMPKHGHQTTGVDFYHAA